MSLAAELLFGLLMAVGLVGVLVPVLPGLLMIGAVAIVWAAIEGTATAWAVAGVMILILAVGTYLKYQRPGRELKAQAVPRRTWTLVAVGGIVGFFVIPVVGAIVGVAGGAYLGELLRFGAHGPALASTKRLLVGIGKGMAFEFAAGVVAVAVWVGAIVAT
jgi:uncharacterized protein YqgC (DUF456 family)